jgi:hypothetical protein
MIASSDQPPVVLDALGAERFRIDPYHPLWRGDLRGQHRNELVEILEHVLSVGSGARGRNATKHGVAFGLVACGLPPGIPFRHALDVTGSLRAP